MIPGELFVKDGEIEINKGRKSVTLSVSNTGDRPIQVGSHYHFFETNPALKFDRKKARAGGEQTPCRGVLPSGHRPTESLLDGGDGCLDGLKTHRGTRPASQLLGERGDVGFGGEHAGGRVSLGAGAGDTQQRDAPLICDHRTHCSIQL